MKKLLVIGAGGFGREVMSMALDISKEKDTEWEPYGFLDDNTETLKDLDTMGFDVIGTISEHVVSDEYVYVCAIADSEVRERICKEFIANGARFIDLIHHTCKIGYSSTTGRGLIMAMYSCITENAKLGDFVIVNAYTSIGHDAVIDDYCTLSAHCDITGHTVLGKSVFLGSSAVITPGVMVGDYARVGAGSIVVRKVKPNTTVFGNPAKRIY